MTSAPAARSAEEPTIRAATAGEHDLVARMNRALIEDTGHRNPMPVAALRARLDDLVAAGWSLDVVELGGRPVGYALHREVPDVTEPSGRRRHLRQFFVIRDVRRRGLGAAALRALAAARWQAGERVVVEVLADHEPGLAFWESQGFAPYAHTLEWRVAEPGAPQEPDAQSVG